MSSDELNMEAYKQGSVEAFSRLYDKYGPLVYGYARKRLPASEVDDFYQSVWRHLHEKRALYSNQPFGPWFFVLIRNLLYDEYRSRARYKKMQELAEVPSITEDHELEDLLAEVPAETAELIRKYYLEGYDYADLEKETGMSQTGLRKRLSRAIQTLKGKFEGKV